MTKIKLFGFIDESPETEPGFALVRAGTFMKEAFILENAEEGPAFELISGTIRKNDLIELTFVNGDLWHGDIRKFHLYLNEGETKSQNLPRIISLPFQSPENVTAHTQQIRLLKIFQRSKKPASARGEGSLDELLSKVKSNTQVHKVDEQRVHIEITMGDLGFAQYPVMVGHVEGDGLYSAESALDRHLEGVLSKQHAFGVYPGDLGTVEVFMLESANHPGAIVIGLGTDFENISAGNLMYSVKNGALKWSLQHPDQKGHSNISTLLIGSGYAGLTVREAIRAILRGIKLANIEILRNAQEEDHAAESFVVDEGMKEIQPIQHVEFIELFEAKALEAAYSIKSIISESEFEIFYLEDFQKIRRVPGVRQSIETGLQSSWWHRLKVEEFDKNGDSHSSLRPFKFTSITGRARADEIILPTNREIVDQLVHETVHQSKWDARIAHALFELLIPNEFKTFSLEQRNILWILSKKTAEYPWELMQDPSGGEKVPLSVRAGMIRQLTTTQYRRVPEYVATRTALVIGDPDAGKEFIKLPGAAKEAKAISKIFKEHGFTDEPSINDSAIEIIKKVHEKDYQIIHLAGHGALGKGKDDLSGMVIGKNNFLTSVDFRQKRQVPSLVFINCCYLGKSDNTQESLYEDRHKLAANLGIQFIEMGAKAVIAAGWLIDDDMAELFATTFYEKMFNGYSFGDAVREARSKVHSTSKESNTWGAYQCYGEPSFTLTSNQPMYDQPRYEFVDPLEAIIRIRNIASASAAASSRDSERQIAQLGHLVNDIPKPWLKKGPILESIGKCFATLDSFDNAIEHLNQLVLLNVSDYSVLALEELANVKVRSAIEKMQVNAPNSDDFRVGKDHLEQAIKHLKLLLRLGETTVRLNLMASALKRKSMLSRSPGKRMELWKKSYSFYKRAYDKTLKETNRVDNYPLLSFLTLTEILVKYGVRKVDNKRLLFSGRHIVKALQLCELHSKEDDYINPNFWDLSVRAPIYTYFTLIAFRNRLKYIKEYYDGSLFSRKEDFDFGDRILREYKKAWSRGGTQHEKRKVLEHFDFIIEAVDISKPANKKDRGDFSSDETKRMNKLHCFFKEKKAALLSYVFNQP